MESARAALAERLRAEGFMVEPDVGGVLVSSADPSFMNCPVTRVSSIDRSSSKRQLARADRFTTTATIRIEEAGRIEEAASRTRLSWQPTFTGNYLNRIDNLRFERPCTSTGVFEELISTALPN